MIQISRISIVSSRFVRRAAFAAGFAVAALASPVPAFAAQAVTAGTTPSSVPTAYLDIQTHEIMGIMPDVVREIGKRSGFDTTFEVIPFPALIQSVVSGKIELIVAGMTPTPKRAEVVDFSQAVLEMGDGIIVKDSDKTVYRSVADLKGKTVGAGAGTDYADALVKLGYDVRMYENAADMARDVALGRITAGFNDYPILKAQEAAGTLKGVRVVDGYTPLRKFPIAFAVKKGNTELLNKVNDALNKMRSDGTLTAILKKWHME